MPTIRQLDPHVADLIAAGEVVERPASVVKELVENALDAGATAVAVEIRRGGMGLIRVTDNGCGIAADQLPTAFLRHATSKLRTAEDLGRIGTLGFRGEALAAISAVSRVDILTRPEGADAGASLHLEGGVPGSVEAAGAPPGTTVVVRDLFFNTPARLKFMRKDSAETAAVAGLMQHLALSRPEVAFKFVKDGEEALHTPGDGRLDSAVYAALGRDFARSLVPVSGRGGETAVDGFVTAPLKGRGSRSMQIFFVNGRFIKSPLLTAALEESYRNQLMKGKFPGCVLRVTLPVPMVDVNVHPAKTQVKFQREQEVFDAVYHTVLDALNALTPAAAEQTLASGRAAEPREDFFKTMDAAAYRAERAGGKKASAAPVREGRQTTAPQPTRQPEKERRTFGGTELRAEAAVHDAGDVPPVWPPRGAVRSALGAPPSVLSREGEDRTPPKRVPAIPAQPEAGTAPEEGQQTLQSDPPPWRMAGEVLNTYIVCEDGDGNVYLIDKHAAHERIHFDRLMASREPPMRQTLPVPAAVELGREDSALLLENLPALEELGFSCEDFGDGTVLVREVPADIDAADAAATLEELAEKLRSGRSTDERRQELLHTIACKAAVKGGWKSDAAELRVLVEKVRSGEIRYCPHGRPVCVRLTKYELEKLFKRA